MGKNILNEIAKMRKMMGLNENPIGISDYQSGENSYGEGDNNFEDMFYKTLNGHEIESMEFEGVVYVDGRNRCIVSDGERIQPTKEQLKELWDEYVESEGLYLEEVTKMRKMMNIKESSNSEMGYNPSPLGEAEGDSVNSIGVISDRDKLIPGYFNQFGLISAGDMIMFDVNGNLVKKGGGYPTGGFKKYENAEELERDICKNYDEILAIFKETAPEEVQINEGTYQTIKKAVDCKIPNVDEDSDSMGGTDFDFNKSAIESASGDKVVQREFDDYDRPLYYSLSDENVNYFIGDSDKGEIIVKYNAKTGKNQTIGMLAHYDEGPRPKDKLDSELYEDEIAESDISEGQMHSGVYYDTTVAFEIKSKVGDLHKIAPYVLELGDRVSEDISGKVSVYEGDKLVERFSDVDAFLVGIKYGATPV